MFGGLKAIHMNHQRTRQLDWKESLVAYSTYLNTGLLMLPYYRIAPGKCLRVLTAQAPKIEGARLHRESV